MKPVLSRDTLRQRAGLALSHLHLASHHCTCCPLSSCLPSWVASLCSNNLTRAKATKVMEVRQRPILVASVKCLVRSTYRPRSNAPKIPNTMKRAPQRPENSWKCEGKAEDHQEAGSLQSSLGHISLPGPFQRTRAWQVLPSCLLRWIFCNVHTTKGKGYDHR